MYVPEWMRQGPTLKIRCQPPVDSVEHTEYL